MGVCTACEQCLNDMNALSDTAEAANYNKITNHRRGPDPLRNVKPMINKMSPEERILYFSYIETLMTKQAYKEADVWKKFGTIMADTEGIENAQSNEVQSTKVIKDGQVLILRNGKTYTMQGIEIK